MTKDKPTVSTPSSFIDSNYKHLFSCPEIVRDLLKGYVPGTWLNDVDYSTLIHVNGSYVSESGKQRHDDVVWRVNINGQWLWVYIILEFQSGEPDQWMALRMMEYVNQLALQITREQKKLTLPEGRIPPILPIVLYNGLQKWRSATDVADCFIKPPEGLDAFLPRLRYLLLDVRRLMQSHRKEIQNFADAIFRMEANRGKDEVFIIIRELSEMLRDPELKSLRRAFNVWVKGLLKRYAQDSELTNKINNIKDIFEEYDMAEAVYQNWADAFRIEGEKKGEKKGERKGERKGETKILMRLLTRRFGPLPEWAETRLNKAKSAQLEKWADAVLDASNLTEVLGAPSQKK